MIARQIALDTLKLMFTNYEYDLDLALGTDAASEETWALVLADENYAGYLVNMLPAINRALDRIQNKRVVTSTAYFTKTDGDYSVIFDTDGGSPVNMIVDALVVYEPYSFKSGYKIEGWYNGAAKVTFPLTLTEDITLKANWVSGNSVYKGYRTFTLPTDLYRIKRVIFENEYEIIGDTDFTTENEKLIVADRCGEYRMLYVPKFTHLTPPMVWTTTMDTKLTDELLALIPYFVKSELYEEDEPQMAAQARNIFEASLEALIPYEESKQTLVERVYASYRL